MALPSVGMQTRAVGAGVGVGVGVGVGEGVGVGVGRWVVGVAWETKRSVAGAGVVVEIPARKRARFSWRRRSVSCRRRLTSHSQKGMMPRARRR
jgi:hypothetical protein